MDSEEQQEAVIDETALLGDVLERACDQCRTEEAEHDGLCLWCEYERWLNGDDQ